jgi:hypothetical protein
VSFGTDHPPPPGPRAAVRWQFGVRAAAIVTGLALLAIVDVHGVAFYFAWGLIGFALITEAAATLVYWRRLRGGERS